MTEYPGRGSGREVLVREAKHVGPPLEPQIAECERAVRDTSALRCVGHLTNGVLDFAVEPASVAEPSVARVERLGRELDLCVQDLNRCCLDLDSGPLIRVVIQGQGGAMFHYFKLAGQSLFAFAEGGRQEQIDAADERVVLVLKSTFARLGLPSLDWGGIPDRPARRVGDTAAHEALEPARRRARGIGPGRWWDQGASRLHSALGLDGLHFLGLFTEGELSLSEDILDHRGLAESFQRISPQARREGYRNVALTCWRYQLRRKSLLDGARLGTEARLVLDVAQGAVFVVPLHSAVTLVGVTLHQNRVQAADLAMRQVEDFFSRPEARAA